MDVTRDLDNAQPGSPSSEYASEIHRGIHLRLLVNFCHQDDDYVIHDRFKKLHLYHIYNAHIRLRELESELVQFELNPRAYRFSARYENLTAFLDELSKRLEAFGRAL
jgi:hypothetical protein